MEVSAEVHFAQKLVSNEKKYRDRALKRLQKYISIRSVQRDGMSYDDFIKIWKGLHYCMWMQDKPLIQEELSQRITNLLHSFPRLSDCLRFVNVFFITEAREWNLIDRFRMDKFMMFIRDMLHETLLLMSEAGWPLSACEAFSQYLANSIMNEDNPKLPDGLKLHIADIFMPELRKVSLEKMTGKKMTILMFPFASFILKTRKMNLASKVVSQTISPALHRYGSWTNRALETSNDDKQRTLDKDKPQRETEEEEMECEKGAEEEENATQRRKIYKFNLSKLLKLMFKMAENKQVHNKNRAIFYKIIQNYSALDSSIFSSESKGVEELKGTKDSEDDDDNGEINLETCWPENQKEALKKKWKRKKKLKEYDSGKDEASTEINEVTTINKEQGACDDEMVPSTSDLPGNEQKDLTSESIVLGHGGISDKKAKKRKRDSSDFETSEVRMKKRARVTGPASPRDGSKPTPKASHDDMKKGKKTHPKKEPKLLDSHKDKNSNAGSQMGIVGGNLNMFSTIEMVKYPEKLKTKVSETKTPPSQSASPGRKSLSSEEPNIITESETSVNELGTSSDSQSVTTTSSSDVKVFMPKKDEKKKKKKSTGKVTASINSSPKREDETVKTRTGPGLFDLMTSPSLVVRRAMEMVMPASDRGPTREKEMKDESTMTPGTKKKVVFDLKKNKANKFKDYLKSLAAESPPVFEPTKSPSQSILKSPALSSSTSSNSLNTDSSLDSFTKKKSTKKSGVPGKKKNRRGKQSPSPSKSKRSSSPKGARKKSKSPRKK